MNDKQAILQAIIQQGMLPLFYDDDAAVSNAVIQTLYRAGVRAIEYTNRGPEALKNFSSLKAAAKQLPGLALGIGTIKTEKDASAFIDAGAHFIVSPVVTSGVAEAVNKAGLLWIPGCMTPTEIAVAQQYEAMLIKLFPADLLKPHFVSAIKELFPGQLFIPTGGIGLDKTELAAWFKAGVCAVGMGSRLITKAILKDKMYEVLHSETVAALALIREAREGGVQ